MGKNGDEDSSKEGRQGGNMKRGGRRIKKKLSEKEED